MSSATRTRSCTDHVDVAVLGADALGAATAWWLARAGATVALLDERTPRQLRLALRGTAWSAHPAWTTGEPDAAAPWRRLERETGAALLVHRPTVTDGDPTGDGLQVRADHAVAALTAAAVGAGAVLRHRTPHRLNARPDGEQVEIDTSSGSVRARHAVVISVDPAPTPARGIELHFTPRHPLPVDAPLIAHHDWELGLLRAAPCAQGHLAVGAAAWPRGTVRDLRDHVRTWFPDVDAEHPEPVGPHARSTATADVTAVSDGPVTTATVTALGSVGVIEYARRLAERVLTGAPALPLRAFA